MPLRRNAGRMARLPNDADLRGGDSAKEVPATNRKKARKTARSRRTRTSKRGTPTAPRSFALAQETRGFAVPRLRGDRRRTGRGARRVARAARRALVAAYPLL